MTAITGFLRTLVLGLIFLGITGGMVCSIAIAKNLHRHHKGHYFAPKSSSPFLKTTNASLLREAQTHLSHLGYYRGKTDGKMGPQTKKAITAFQKDHGLTPNGKLTAQTSVALIEADRPGPGGNLPPLASRDINSQPLTDFYATHPDYYGYVAQPYSDPMLTSTPTVSNNGPEPLVQNIPNRFAKIDLSEVKNGSRRNYEVTVDGQPLLQAADQPAVIGVSRTFSLGDEDAIIFTAYRPDSNLCPYHHYLLALSSGGNKVQEVGNCTNGYQAKTAQNSLYVMFPQKDTNSAVADTWRYENGDLERL